MWCCNGWVALIVGLIVYKVLDWLIRRLYIGSYGERYIFITGCDTGFGNLLARRLDTLGCHVFAGCLTEAGETDLRKACSDRLQAVSLDVAKPESVRHAFEAVKAKLPPGKGLWGLVNNAGILGMVGLPEWYITDNFKATSDVNLYGPIDVTMAFLPLVKKEKGRVVNMTSVAGRVSVPVLLPYCVSKFGLEAFTDGLRRGLRPFNVKAILIEPGWHSTPITHQSNFNTLVTKTWNQASAETKAEYGEEYYKYCCSDLLTAFEKTGSLRPNDVIDAYEHALLGWFPRTRYVVGNDAKFIFVPLSVLPEWLSDFLLDKSDPKKPLPAAAKK